MQTFTCDKVSIRLECNHTIVMSDVTKIEYDEHSVTITLTYDTFMLKREVVLYPESFVTGLAVRVIRCYVSNRYIGYFFSCVNGSIKFTQSTTA